MHRFTKMITLNDHAIGNLLKSMICIKDIIPERDVQWSLYFKTTHGTKKMWSYIVGGFNIKVI